MNLVAEQATAVERQAAGLLKVGSSGAISSIPVAPRRPAADDGIATSASTGQLLERRFASIRQRDASLPKSLPFLDDVQMVEVQNSPALASSSRIPLAAIGGYRLTPGGCDRYDEAQGHEQAAANLEESICGTGATWPADDSQILAIAVTNRFTFPVRYGIDLEMVNDFPGANPGTRAVQRIWFVSMPVSRAEIRLRARAVVRFSAVHGWYHSRCHVTMDIRKYRFLMIGFELGSPKKDFFGEETGVDHLEKEIATTPRNSENSVAAHTVLFAVPRPDGVGSSSSSSWKILKFKKHDGTKTD